MTKKKDYGKVFNIRLVDSLVSRIDAFAKDFESQLPGFRMTRTAAIRLLLTTALNQHDEQETPV